jgi:hypothetical protein
MTNKKINYGNRTVKSDEELFAPDDLDVEIVGGKSQTDPFGYLSIEFEGVEGNVLAVSKEDYEKNGKFGEFEEEEDDGEEAEEKLGAVTSVLFEQEGAFTGDGTYLANVTAIISDVKGADDYDVEFIKIS